ncbi:hypothetical protein OIV83_003121 [Microbotryomycetes sp. JL201]|nr:hypothetical protein OIV83_003121 [Microbotryomycetes sp. JL201]
MAARREMRVQKRSAALTDQQLPRRRTCKAYEDPLQGIGAIYITWQATEPGLDNAPRSMRRMKKVKPEYVIPLECLPPLPTTNQLPSPAPSETIFPLYSPSDLPSYATRLPVPNQRSQKTAIDWTPPTDRASPFLAVAAMSVGLSTKRQAQTASQAYLDLMDERDRQLKLTESSRVRQLASPSLSAYSDWEKPDTATLDEVLLF